MIVVPATAGALVFSGPQGPLATPKAAHAEACVDGSSRFAVAYVPNYSFSGELMLQRFDAAGKKDGAPIPLAGGVLQFHGTFDIACALDGEIVVTWEALGDGDGLGIFAQIFNSAGTALTSEFQVNAQATGPQQTPRVAVSDADELLFAWGHDSLGLFRMEELHVRLFDLTGSALSTEQAVQTIDDGTATGAELLLQTGSADAASPVNGSLPLVGATAADGFVVVRTDFIAGSSTGLTAQLYDATDAPVADPFIINAGRLGTQTLSSLVVTGDGDFLATWFDRSPFGGVVTNTNHVAFICAGADPTCDPCLGLGTADSDGDGFPDECDPCTRPAAKFASS